MSHDHGPRSVDPLPLSLLTESAAFRVAYSIGVLVLLWLTIAWAVAKP